VLSTFFSCYSRSLLPINKALKLPIFVRFEPKLIIAFNLTMQDIILFLLFQAGIFKANKHEKSEANVDFFHVFNGFGYSIAEYLLTLSQYIKTVVRGYNIITTIRGENYGTIRDKLIVVMAHYDTHVGGTPGVDENGSGVAALLELGRLLSRDVYCTRYSALLLLPVTLLFVQVK